jgi:GNAT superfamily N-acetyltransferase
MAALKVTTWHLEMASRDALRPPSRAVEGLAVREVTPPDPDFNRRLYWTVGDAFEWRDLRPWSAQQWRDWALSPALTTLRATVDGVEAGYAELHDQGGGDVELAHFGLLPAFIGRGVGSAFLCEVVRRAWDLGATRVWLHTCSLDHPTALPGYQARGFRVFKIEETERAEA